MRVLLLTAGVGGGHEAAGSAAAEELEGRGFEVSVRDGLGEMSPSLQRAISRSYRDQGRHAPALLGPVFALATSAPGAAVVRRATGALYAEALLDLLDRERPEVVVSTYPLVTAALGALRRSAGFTARTVALIPDYGAHSLWVSPELDLHLVPCEASARLVAGAGGKALPVRMPVGKRFLRVPERREARETLGIPEDAFVALVVGGVLGLGDLKSATESALRSGAYTLVVTGRNDELKERLERKFARSENVRVLGWTDRMPDLMAASDCLLQNAGGMTCNEAISLGLPVVIFSPLPGHGAFNARVMSEVGVARLARNERDLEKLLVRAAKGRLPAKTEPPPSPALSLDEALLSLSGAPEREVLRPVPGPPRSLRPFTR